MHTKALSRIHVSLLSLIKLRFFIIIYNVFWKLSGNHCGCQFVRKYNWLRHTREHEKEKRYTCTYCGKKFHRAYYLTEHRRVHSGERPFGEFCFLSDVELSLNFLVSRLSIPLKKAWVIIVSFSILGCNICGKRSATKTNHNKHIKIHHARDPLTAEG